MRRGLRLRGGIRFSIREGRDGAEKALAQIFAARIGRAAEISERDAFRFN